MTAYTVPWFVERDPDFWPKTLSPSQAGSIRGKSDSRPSSPAIPATAAPQVVHKAPVQDDPALSLWDNADEVESLSRQKSYRPGHQSTPSWSQNRSIRRGKDHPFGVKDAPASTVASPEKPAITLPQLVRFDGGISARTDGARHIESFRLPFSQPCGFEPHSPTDVDLHKMGRLNAFPPRIEDDDLPIPLPRLSEWIRADAAKGINVHSVPPLSPDGSQ